MAIFKLTITRNLTSKYAEPIRATGKILVEKRHFFAKPVVVSNDCDFLLCEKGDVWDFCSLKSQTVSFGGGFHEIEVERQ